MTNQAYIIKLVEEHLAGTDLFLVEAKVTAGKITVLIDKTGGVTINECSDLSRFMVRELEPSGMLDTVELEVSSPGTDQPLKVFRQYLGRIGRGIKVTTKDGKEHEGILLSARPEGIELMKTVTIKVNKKKEARNENVHFPFETIKETKIILTNKN